MSGREMVAEALKEAVTSASTGTGQATYGGADSDEEEEDDVGKEWVQDPSPEASTMRWRHTETDEYRYQEDKPAPGEGEAGDDSEFPDIASELPDVDGTDGMYVQVEGAGFDLDYGADDRHDFEGLEWEQAEVESVSLENLTMTQEGVRPEKVQYFINNPGEMEEVEEPVEVGRVGDEYVVHDGHHRLVAAKLLGYDEADVNVLDVEGDDGAGEEFGKFQKEWVQDPSPEASTMRWRHTETDEYRYQENKPEPGEGGGDESGDAGEEEGGDLGIGGDQELRDVMERLWQDGKPSRDEIHEELGTEEVDYDKYEEEYGINAFDLSTGFKSALDEIETLSEFDEMAESGELGEAIKDEYSLFSDPADLEDIPAAVRDSIISDARKRFIVDSISEYAGGVREVTEEPELEDEEEEGTEEVEEVDYSEKYPSMEYHDVDAGEIEEGDYIVMEDREGRHKIQVDNVEEEGGTVIISGLSPDGDRYGYIDGKDRYELHGQLPEGDSYQSGVEKQVAETISEYEEEVDAVLEEFDRSRIRRESEEVGGRMGDFERLPSDVATSVRSEISEHVDDDEAVAELWARMNEMKQSSTGKQRKYVDALAKVTFGMEDADVWGDADPEDFDFTEEDKKAMAITAGVSQEVVDVLSDGTIHRGVHEAGEKQLASAWLEDPMDPEITINENATANYSTVEDVAENFGDITIDKEVGDGSVLNGQDLIRGFYRASAAADEAEVWSAGSEQTVSAWDLSLGRWRGPSDDPRVYLGDHQKPIEELEDEGFIRLMSRHIETLASEEDVSLSGDAARNLETFAERAEEVADKDLSEVVQTMTKEDTKSDVDIDLTSEAGWLDSLRDEESESTAEKAVQALSEVLNKEWVQDPSPQASTMRWRNTETDEYRYQEQEPGSGEGEDEEGEGAGSPAEEAPGEDSGEEQSEMEMVDGQPVTEVDPEDLEEGDTVMIHGQEFDAASNPVFEDPNGNQRVRLELEDGNIYTPEVDDLQGAPLTEEYDIGDYWVDSEWGAKFAHGVNTGGIGEQGSDGFLAVRDDIQHHASDIDNEELLADVLLEELEGRNSASATHALESRLRALGKDPDKMLEERGYGKTEGKTEGGEDEEYPLDEFDGVREHIEDFAHPSRSVSQSVSAFGTRDKGLENREHWETIAENSSTEDLEYMRGYMAKKQLVRDIKPVEEEEAEEIREMSVEEAIERYPDQIQQKYESGTDSFDMVNGLLYYREDSDVGVDDVYDIREGANYDSIDGTTDEMRERVKETMDQVDPVMGAALSAHTGKMQVGRPEEEDWNGVYHSSSGNIEAKKTKKDTGYLGSPSTVAHELGHSLHYMMGIGGGGDWGQNDWGEPNHKRVDTPAKDLRNEVGLEPDDIDEWDVESAGWDPEAFEMSERLKEEWERYQESQLDSVAVDVGDLEVGETYEVSGVGEATFVEQNDHLLVFEDEDTGQELTLSMDQVAFDNEVMTTTEGKNEVQQLRSYQAKGLHEFFTVSFSHWVADRQKLEDRHPELGEIYDEYFGKKTQSQEYEGLEFPDGPEDVEAGQEVLFTEGEDKPDRVGEITEIREGGVRVDDAFGGHWLGWDQVAWEAQQ